MSRLVFSRCASGKIRKHVGATLRQLLTDAGYWRATACSCGTSKKGSLITGSRTVERWKHRDPGSVSAADTTTAEEAEEAENRTFGDESTPLIVQLIAKKTRFPKEAIGEKEKAGGGARGLSVEELESYIDDLKWDFKALQKKLELGNVPEEEFALAVDRTGVDPQRDGEYGHVVKTRSEHVGNERKLKAKLYGCPDPSVPVSKVPCPGCGAKLHCQDPGVSGYLPSQKFLSLTVDELKKKLCQRCNLMKYHNFCLNVKIPENEYVDILAKVKETRALVIVVVDMMDVTNSIPKDLLRAVGRNRPLYIVGNKVDLIPKDCDGYLERIKTCLIKSCEERGLNPTGKNIRHACLVSAKTGFGIECLVTKLMMDWDRNGHVFVVGCTNAGKSSLFNALLCSDYCKSHVRNLFQRATVSVWPGTTINLLKFPIITPTSGKVHKRMQRLSKEMEEDVMEEKMKRMKLKSEKNKHMETLIGHIGQTEFIKPPNPEYEGFSLHSFEHAGVKGIIAGHIKETKSSNDNLQLLKYQQDLENSRWFYDTPGLLNPEQVINLLTQEELLKVLPKTILKSRTVILKPSQVLFVSGLGRVDYVQGDNSILLTVFTSIHIPVHVLEREKADEFYSKNIGSKILGVPLGDRERLESLPALVGQEFHLIGTGWKICMADIVLSSVGWVAVATGRNIEVTVRAYTPSKQGCHLRTPPLLQKALQLRGPRIKGTPYYHIKKHLVESV